MNDAILVLNAGSSSIKFSVFGVAADALRLQVRGQIEGLYTAPRFSARDADGTVLGEKSWPADSKLGHDGALDYLSVFLRQQAAQLQLVGVGHRVVHGGREYTRPVPADRNVLAILERLIPLAPLHQPHNLTPIRLLLERWPELPQVACFDTAFHATNPPVARLFALPRELSEAGVQRYGFHGLSYEYIAAVLADFDPTAAAGRSVVLHLGNGASMCALNNGTSIASTMGFTAVDGLPMGTRCGALDPGVILYLMDQHGMDARAIEKLIYQQSGLLGLSGISSDMRVLLASTEPAAQLAIDYYVYRIRRELGSLAAALGGLDAVIFTAGIGENSAIIRQRVCHDAAWLGIDIDAAANTQGGPRISTPHSPVTVWTIPTNEELMIARHTQQVLSGTSTGRRVSS